MQQMPDETTRQSTNVSRETIYSYVDVNDVSNNIDFDYTSIDLQIQE
jgi:hypothetical protein